MEPKQSQKSPEAEEQRLMFRPTKVLELVGHGTRQEGVGKMSFQKSMQEFQADPWVKAGQHICRAKLHKAQQGDTATGLSAELGYHRQLGTGKLQSYGPARVEDLSKALCHFLRKAM